MKGEIRVFQNVIEMKIGLVHGRFQPFHNGHKFLVDRMLEECDKGVILIGAADKSDEKNPQTLEDRIEVIKNIYKSNNRLYVGANIDLNWPYSHETQWDVLFASCVLSLTGYMPTDIYGGNKYNVSWDRVKVNIHRFDRYMDISATEIRQLIKDREYKRAMNLVPEESYEMIMKKNDY